MNEVEIYTRNNIVFYLYPTKTLIQTKFQTFLLVPARHNYSKRLETLRDKMRDGKIDTLTDVVSYCNLHPGRKGLLGIEMVNTIMERHV